MQRGVWQCTSLALNYCKASGSSQGVRDFLNTPAIVAFARENPQMQIQVQEKRNRHPHVVAYYANKRKNIIDLRNVDEHGVLPKIYQLRNRIGRDMQALKRWNRPEGKTKTVQGTWDYATFLHQDVGLSEPVLRIEDPTRPKPQNPVFRPPRLPIGSLLTQTARKQKEVKLVKFRPLPSLKK